MTGVYCSAMAIASQLARDIRTVFREDLDPAERSALLSWLAKQGRISVDLGIDLSSLAGTFFATLPLVRALRRRT